MFADARHALPHECCGLLGGSANSAKSVYPCKNVAANALSEYEAAPTDLFHAQRQMRERGEELLSIYHSHPRQSDPLPSETDVKRAFYREAVYLIIGCDEDKCVLRAFRLDEDARRWERADFTVSE